eukprot:TRINITY_DN40154_c0_g1_i1.p1 TRINITY_DN40154_c0_g1~~TRINITY_DN40154_c0_g1_i1.p1  ORF type:complete len:726 (-),score=135.67 TRINITY_DN40154_c0_g1_i1:126-2225(-)
MPCSLLYSSWLAAAVAVVLGLPTRQEDICFSDAAGNTCDDEVTLHLLQTRGKQIPAKKEPLPNPPHWPSSVWVFDPGDKTSDIEHTFYNLTSDLINHTTGHFSTKRFAFLFKPGSYDVNINVGYYVQVLGLGANADDVVFTGAKGVWAPAADPNGAGSLDTFWRGAENFKTEASEGMRWAVSQAAPLRRLRIANQLLLHDCGHGPSCMASGGFMANLVVGGPVQFGSQQQWFSRSVDFGKGALGGAWNFVFVGSPGAPNSSFPAGDTKSISTIDRAPVKAEKPFITIDSDGKYTLQIPKVEFNARGANLDFDAARTKSVPFEEVYVAADSDDSQSIQAKLDAGYHLVLSPGIYHLKNSLTLKHAGQTVLGLGMATLMSPPDGSPCIRVLSKVPGVRIAGLMLGASIPHAKANMTQSTLLQWGDDLFDQGKADDPGFLFDIFARVGGDYAEAETGTVLKISSGHVIGDHLWLWRADHARLKPGEAPGWLSKTKRSQYHVVQNYEAKAQHGLEVFGDDVTMYGLQVEHFLQDQTVWHGERGQTYFYQCELPYDVTQSSFADRGYAGYVVADTVNSHTTYGVGVYSFFRDVKVVVQQAVHAPKKDGVRLVNSFTRFLDGFGGMDHVVSYHNGKSLENFGGASLKDTPTNRVPFGIASDSSEIKQILHNMERSAALRSLQLSSPAGVLLVSTFIWSLCRQLPR